MLAPLQLQAAHSRLITLRPRRSPAAVEQALGDRIVEGPVFERDAIVAFRSGDARRLLREEHG